MFSSTYSLFLPESLQTVAGGAWQTTTTAAATVRSAIRRLKEQGVVA